MLRESLVEIAQQAALLQGEEWGLVAMRHVARDEESLLERARESGELDV